MSDNPPDKTESSDVKDVAEASKETPTTNSIKISFADWKKSKEAVKPERTAGARAGEKAPQGRNPGNGHNNQRNDNFQNNRGNGPRNRNQFPTLSGPPPLPLQLLSMTMGFNGMGGPCGPPPNMMGMGMNMGGGPGPGPGRRPPRQQQRPLQPPPFWEDMMSPQRRPPPIQPPMPKCPSLWNLVPKEKSHNQRQQQQQRKPNANKKFKPNNNNNKANKDAALMPPPRAPTADSSSNSSASSTSGQANGGPAKKPKAGPFVQVNGQWLQKPEAPPPLDESEPGTKEDRQRQWKEYRQAMKPFKNREFHNCKRTVQRLGKLPRDQLDEQQLDRLQKAEEYIGAHKAMLTIKHAERWVQQGDQQSGATAQGQVYVRRPANSSTFWDQQKKSQGADSFHRGGPAKKQFFGTGRAIKGGGEQFPPQRGNFLGSGFGLEPGSTTNSGYYTSYHANFVKGDTLG